MLFISRKTEALSVGFGRLAGVTTVDFVGPGGQHRNTADIKKLVKKEFSYMRGSKELKQMIRESILNRAQGNFLWVRLVLEEIVSCHSEQAIQEALEEIPRDMNILYERMEQSIIDPTRSPVRTLAKIILEWAVCAQRPLALGELA